MIRDIFDIFFILSTYLIYLIFFGVLFGAFFALVYHVFQILT